MTRGDPAIETATIEWRQGRPISTRYRDPYFSTDGSSTGGRAETAHVFLGRNQLAERWRRLPSGGRFAIGETGFGTGLNFLCAAELWLQTAPHDAHLHFISAEKYPLTEEDLAKALRLWPELAGLAQQLLDAYPPPVPGFHRLHLAAGRATLTLLFDDATAAFEQLKCCDHPLFAHVGPRIDAWFLDGFAPGKNPELWTEALFAAIANLSASGTTFSTFTAAGAVRRGLATAGFRVAKVAGFGSKRDMICGDFLSANGASPAIARPQRARIGNPTPWHLPNRQIATPSKQAVVVGGGIAGCTTAASLARRGWQVALFERRGALASEASGNPQAIVFPRLSAQSSPLARINLSALLYASRFYAPFWAHVAQGQQSLGERCGVLILPEKPGDKELFSKIATRHQLAPELVRLCTGAELAAIAGVPLATGIGLHFPSLGWIRPASVCAALVEHPGIRVEQADIASLAWEDSETHWHLTDQLGRTSAIAPLVIIANGVTANRFAQTQELPLKAIRGQISQAPATTASKRLKTVICGAGYLAPAIDGFHTLGATYAVDSTVTAVRAEDHQANLDRLAIIDAALSTVLGNPTVAQLSGRAALRCASPDYLPLIGPVPQHAEFLAAYATLRRDARASIPHAGRYWPGLYINCAHGSRGMSYAPLGAELLASLIEGEVLPLERDLATAMNPARFLIRGLKRRQW